MIYTVYMGRKTAGGGEGGGEESISSQNSLWAMRHWEANSHSKPLSFYFFFLQEALGSVAVYQNTELVINKTKISAVREDYI